MSTNIQPPILIAGGGIGGLAAALGFDQGQLGWAGPPFVHLLPPPARVRADRTQASRSSSSKGLVR